METRVCSHCKELRSLSEFYVHKSGRQAGQYCSQCRICYADKYAAKMGITPLSEPVACNHCGEPFLRKTLREKSCSDACRAGAHNAVSRRHKRVRRSTFGQATVDGKKMCTTCLRFRTPDEFLDTPERSWESCRECRQAAKLRYTLKRYGVNEEWYEAIRGRQGGVCAICRTEGKFNSRPGRLSIDHRHSDGVVRGLLCGSCNTGLGSFRDDPNLLIEAALYLEMSWPLEVAA